MFKRATLSPKLSKKDVLFCSAQFEIVEGDYEGATLMINYLPIPIAITPDDSKAARFQKSRLNEAFGRFCRAFKIVSKMPPVSITDPESYSRWQEWISEFYENTGKVTIQNQEFPVGSGRLRSSVNDFVF